MDKSTAIKLLGGSVSKAAKEMGVTASAVSQWPEELPKSAIDKVQAALWRRAHGQDVRPCAASTQQQAA